MDHPDLIVGSSGPGIVLLTLDRPERRNALSTALLSAVAGTLGMAAQDPMCRVAVITGGPTVFAAGADVAEIEQLGADDPLDSPRFRAWQTIRAFPKPLIGAVEGSCLGAGLELAMACDIVVAGAGAQLGQPETNLGIIPGGGGTALLPRLVGRALAMRMILTGEPIDAEHAVSAGLIADVTASGGALERAIALAATIAGRAPKALMAAKASVIDADRLMLGDHLRAERRRFIALLGTSDKAEGITAFRARRAPVWTGD